MRYYFVKNGSPAWIHVPGTPFSLPGIPEGFERVASAASLMSPVEYEDAPVPTEEPRGLLAALENAEQIGGSQEESDAAPQGLLSTTPKKSEGLLAGAPKGMLAKQPGMGYEQQSALSQLPQEAATAPVPLVATTSNLET